MYRTVLPLVIAGMLAAASAVADENKSKTMAAATIDDKAEAGSMAAAAGSKIPVNGRIIHQTNGKKIVHRRCSVREILRHRDGRV
jgi:hypothetical protein